MEKQFLGKGVGIEFSHVLMLVIAALISHTWFEYTVIRNVMTKLVCARIASTHRREILVEIDVCRTTQVTEDHSPRRRRAEGFLRPVVPLIEQWQQGSPEYENARRMRQGHL